MTKKDYELIAKVIKQATITGKPEIISKHNLVTELAEALYIDNQRFDVKRFFKACNWIGIDS